MKKFLIISLASLVLSLSALANQVSLTVVPATMTNLFTGYGKITSIVLVAPTATNAVGILVDTPTNSITYTSVGYTNLISYITNVVTYPQYFYTNYYGVVTTLTNQTTTSPGQVAGAAYALVDVTNIVSAFTNSYPLYTMGVAGNLTTVINPANVNIIRGAWFTNSGAQPFSVTLTWTPQ